MLYFNQKADVKDIIDKQLMSAAELKTDQIVNWRKERLADAYILMESPFLAESINEYITSPTAKIEKYLLTRFNSLKARYKYSDAIITDTNGKIILNASNSNILLPDEVFKSIKISFEKKQPILGDLHRSERNPKIHVDIIVPFFTENGEPIGTIILCDNAEEFLFPLIQFWPAPSETAETLLVERDGDNVIYLNELRHQKDTALKLMFPLTREDLPSVMAVKGKKGVMAGTDYRGVRVISVLKAIPDSPWFMVSKIDESEAFAPWRANFILIILFSVGLFAMIAFATGMIWQGNQKIQLQQLYKLEAEKRRAAERYHITLLSIGDGVISTNAKTCVEIMNPVAENLTGWKQNEALGKPLEEVFKIINEDSRNTVENPVVRAMKEGIIVGLANHTLLVSRDGKEFPIADSGSPIFGENRSIDGAVLVFRDQTENRRKEKELEHLNKQLMEAHKMESIGRLAGGIAHDFNNMLAIIIGNAQISLLDDKLDESTRENFNEIVKAAKRSSELTRQLLGFAQKQAIQPKSIDMNSSIESMFKMLRKIIKENIAMEWRPSGDICQVLMDPSQVDQIILNLVINSNDALRSGGKIEMKTEKIKIVEKPILPDSAPAPGEYVAITIKDNGCGMDAETLSHIFEPFYTKKKFGSGAGLGLATVHGIVKQNKGFIFASSELDKGTEIKIYIPQHVAPIEKKPLADEEKKNVKGKETILLVEDEVAILNLAKSILNSLGYKVLIAVNPNEAIKIAETHTEKIDLLMTDVVMPEMNGKELARRLCEMRPGLKCLYMSGYNAEIVAEQGIIDKGVNFIQKPFDIGDIAVKLREVIS